MAILDEQHKRRAIVRSSTPVDVIAIPREHFEVMVNKTADLKQTFQRVLEQRRQPAIRQN
jgi:CRP-like cAMP-binding protein